MGFFSRHSNVYLYVPNLIGYARVAAAIYAFAVAFTSPYQCVAAYFLSFVCDELDGRFARMLNQTSTLGAVLDMVTDRLATTGLLLVVTMVYPQLHVVTICLIFLDVFSHWFQMYASLAVGATTHKDVKSKSWLVRTYYGNRLFMGYCCVSCEVLYLVVYASTWPELMRLVVPLPAGARLALPAKVAELAPVLLRFTSESGGLPLMTLFGLLALPGFLTKQLCNWVQLRTAADQLIAFDLNKQQRKGR
ncbi:phosphatidylinositol synthase [Volvox carteri f. nagariensis]|uniref:CDP-diacylglycerol--inositol 3-phosphatidyltransferase n=1 Tax=Volvox carteri f. nagariensis TaxID=3068 RepID=D8TPK4_VOLCA|nr:phosphatidylinositol synthase [Volvox carteri f. nagariensis]EFJ50781.1 phosphatidylinositol synthase [Volvox carteri f. nagariensis]|eukprot:XP_002948374.1 phosphatidylinositol synthase [Volvox carteri f. nagariensis]